MDESTVETRSSAEPMEAAQAGEPAFPAPEAPPLEPPAKKHGVWMYAGLGLLVIVLAAAAYVGGNWLNRRPAGEATKGAGGPQMKISGSGAGSKMFQIEPSKDLPQTKPDVVGAVVRIEDNSFFVGTGKISRIVQKSGSGSQQAAPPTYDGPVLEVVVTHDTQIFRDETMTGAPPKESLGESGTIQQVIKPGSVDEITKDAVIQVWGEKTGERTIARILVYQQG